MGGFQLLGWGLTGSVFYINDGAKGLCIKDRRGGGEVTGIAHCVRDGALGGSGHISPRGHTSLTVSDDEYPLGNTLTRKPAHNKAFCKPSLPPGTPPLWPGARYLLRPEWVPSCFMSFCAGEIARLLSLPLVPFKQELIFFHFYF